MRANPSPNPIPDPDPNPNPNPNPNPYPNACPDPGPGPDPNQVTAENLAEEYGITREASDAYAVSSQQKWAAPP